MRSSKEISQWILNLYKVRKCKAGNIIRYRDIKAAMEKEFTQDEIDLAHEVLEDLMNEGYLDYDECQGRTGFILMTKGYDQIRDF